jgi:RNA polymerase sigma-70 factor (TIGR02957 family)
MWWDEDVTEVIAGHDELRPLMFAVAYRMLGSVAEAEDVIQEAFLRMHVSPVEAASPEAWATTITTRLAIDQLRSARARRETYTGDWLPEPLVSSTAVTDRDPAAAVERSDSLSQAFLLVLERLSPVERAVFLLREVFEYDYDAIAEIVGKTPGNCRQILVRARERVRESPTTRFEPSRERRQALAERFFAACWAGDLAGLEAVLAQDVAFHGDGGGKVSAIARPVTGRLQVARFILGLMRQARLQHMTLTPALVNGQPGAQARDADGNLLAVLSLQIIDGRIQTIYNVLNPDKLRHLSPSRPA